MCLTPCRTIEPSAFSDAQCYEAAVLTAKETEEAISGPSCPIVTGKARLLPEQVNRLREAVEYRRAEPLAELLREAEAAHNAFEHKHGLDTDWASWYARWLTGRLEYAS